MYKVLAQLAAEPGQPFGMCHVQLVYPARRVATFGFRAVDVGPGGQIEHHVGTRLPQEGFHRPWVQHVKLRVTRRLDRKLAVPPPPDSRADQPRAAQHENLVRGHPGQHTVRRVRPATLTRFSLTPRPEFSSPRTELCEVSRSASTPRAHR